MPVLTCEACSLPFHVPPSKAFQGRKYCSKRCYGKARTTSISVTCHTCHAIFLSPPSDISSIQFCSYACAYAARRRSVILSCRQCHGPFEVPQSTKARRYFCSKQCYTLSQTVSVTLTCAQCQKPFTVKPHDATTARFCSRQCFALARIDPETPRRTRAGKRLYAHTHPDECKVNNARRRARKRLAPINDFTTAQWQEIKAIYKYRCAYCDKKVARLTMDHIVPLIKGGSHTASNIVPACQSCNSKKHDGPPPRAIQPVLLTISLPRTKRIITN